MRIDKDNEFSLEIEFWICHGDKGNEKLKNHRNYYRSDWLMPSFDNVEDDKTAGVCRSVLEDVVK